VELMGGARSRGFVHFRCRAALCFVSVWAI
jgi:hypothetical protein